jgi:hypothetical protein
MLQKGRSTHRMPLFILYGGEIVAGAGRRAA